MDSSLVLRSYHYGVSQAQTALVERIGMLPMTIGRERSFLSTNKRNLALLCIKTPEAAPTANPDDRLLEKSDAPRSATFPNVFESLVQEVCDETEIAELKLKIGGFEMHMKRNIGATKASVPTVIDTTPAPVPSKPLEVSAPVAPPPKPSERATPFTNVSFGKSSRLTALEASGASGYVLVASPTVGSFRRNRTVKGKKQPPIFKEGDLIKEGQVIGYLDQFGTELPVKSDVAGEVLKLLVNDGEPVGYGDPLIAVLPSFHGITK